MIFLLLSNYAFSQERSKSTIWHLTVIDSATSKGVAKATISINKARYFSTDNNGTVYINKDLIGLKDSVGISCIGYKSVCLRPNINHKFPDTVKISFSITELNIVNVGQNQPALVVMGDVKKKYNTHRITGPSESQAQFIPNDKNIKGTITSVQYVVNDQLHGIELPFRVRLFTKMKDSITLDKELTTDSIIVYNPEKKQTLSVDISKYNIQLPKEGVIAIFETLAPSFYGKDSVWYDDGRKYPKSPGIDMDQTKNNWEIDRDKIDRKTSYSMVGPEADRWNLDTVYDQWYVYRDGNNFAITITVVPN